MIDVKFIDERSMLVAFKLNNKMMLLGPPYNLARAKPMSDKFNALNTLMSYENEDQFSFEMKEFQKMFAASLTQNIITKYSGGMTKNFTPSETRAMFLKRLEDCLAKTNFPDLVLHELHALQMTSGFSTKENTSIKIMLKQASEDVSKKIENRLNTPVLNYNKDIDRYMNSIAHYTTLFKDPELQKDAMEQAKTAIAHLIKNHKKDMPSELKLKIDEVYSHLNEEYREILKANGEYYIKPWQFKHTLEEPGLRLQKK